MLRNVTNFGAFVDVGVHQDGLVHVSQISDRFVQDPKSVVHVGEVVKVRVLEVNPQLKRISLTMKRGGEKHARPEKHKHPGKKPKPVEQPPKFTVDDLRRKFSNR